MVLVQRGVVEAGSTSSAIVEGLALSTGESRGVTTSTSLVARLPATNPTPSIPARLFQISQFRVQPRLMAASH